MQSGKLCDQIQFWKLSMRRSSLRLRFFASLASGESQFFDFRDHRWPVFSGAALSRMDVSSVSIWFAKPSTVGWGFVKSEDGKIYCCK